MNQVYMSNSKFERFNPYLKLLCEPNCNNKNIINVTCRSEGIVSLFRNDNKHVNKFNKVLLDRYNRIQCDNISIQKEYTLYQ